MSVMTESQYLANIQRRNMQEALLNQQRSIQNNLFGNSTGSVSDYFEWRGEPAQSGPKTLRQELQAETDAWLKP